MMRNDQKSNGSGKKGNNFGKNGKSKQQGSNKSNRSNNFKNWKNKGNSSNNENDTKLANSNNDATWYKATDQIARDAGQFSFNNPLGMPNYGVINSGASCFPGVCALWYAPTVGDTSQATSAINLQGKKLISFLRSKVSNKLGFAAADILMYLIAMDSMYSFYSYCVRLYGMHFAYMSMNRYYPQTLFKALGVNADATSDWNKFRTWLNTWAYQLSQVYVPSSISYFARHMWMNANVYLDAPDAKAQSYIFTPEYLYKWNSTASANGTCLIPTAMPTAAADGASLTAIMYFGETLLTELLEDVDIGELSGLVLRAFGEGNCIKLSTIPEDFSIAPVYNPEVMPQIHNATLCGSIRRGTDPTTAFRSAIVLQTEVDTLSAYYEAETSTLGAHTTEHLRWKRILDLESVTPTVDEVFIATRLMVGGTFDTENQNINLLQTFGTEVLTKAEIGRAHV